MLYILSTCLIEPFSEIIISYTKNEYTSRDTMPMSSEHVRAKLIRYWTSFCFYFYSHCCIDIPTYKAWILKDSEKDSCHSCCLVWQALNQSDRHPSRCWTRWWRGEVIVELLYFEYLTLRLVLKTWKDLQFKERRAQSFNKYIVMSEHSLERQNTYNEHKH